MFSREPAVSVKTDSDAWRKGRRRIGDGQMVCQHGRGWVKGQWERTLSLHFSVFLRPWSVASVSLFTENDSPGGLYQECYNIPPPDLPPFLLR